MEDIPRQVMDREIDIGFVKDEPAFHGLKSAVVHTDQLILIASPHHPFASRRGLQMKDLDNEPFVLHHLCSTTEQKILRIFDTHGVRCNIAAELWSFENVRYFVQQGVGLAIVPRVAVMHELATGTLAGIPLQGLDMPRPTLMVFRDRGYMSDSAQQFIDIVRKFKWESWLPSLRSGSTVLPPGTAGHPARLKTSA